MEMIDTQCLMSMLTPPPVSLSNLLVYHECRRTSAGENEIMAKTSCHQLRRRHQCKRKRWYTPLPHQSECAPVALNPLPMLERHAR